MAFTTTTLTATTTFTEVELTSSTSFTGVSLTASTDFDIARSLWEDAAELFIGSWDMETMFNWEDLD